MALVVFSPSQQTANEYAGGATGVTDSEARWMRAVAAESKRLWDAQNTGIPSVVLNKGSWRGNAEESNRLGSSVHVAQHTNAGGGRGTEIWYRSTADKRLADALYPPIAAASNQPDRGVKASTGYGEINTVNAPCVIIEYAYHDNVTEAAEIRASIAEYAQATVKGLLAYFDKTADATKEAPVALNYIVFSITDFGDSVHRAALRSMAPSWDDLLKETAAGIVVSANAGANSDAYIAYVNKHGLPCTSVSTTSESTSTMVVREYGTLPPAPSPVEKIVEVPAEEKPLRVIEQTADRIVIGR